MVERRTGNYKGSINKGCKVIGFCLGTQILSDVLGGRVFRNKYKEIGWHTLSGSVECPSSLLFPSEFLAFQWHGDTFDVPPGAVLLAKSEACENQAFLYKNQVLGMQFHLEVTKESLSALVENCREDITEGPYVEKRIESYFDEKKIKEAHLLLEKILESFLSL